jgi:hypothetical protein
MEQKCGVAVAVEIENIVDLDHNSQSLNFDEV